MFAENCARSALLIQKQLKLIILFGILLSIVFLAISPAILGVEYLDEISSAIVLERYVALIGIILITPLFMPEQNKNIAELVEAKYTSYIKIVLIRLVIAIIVLLLLITIMGQIMTHNGCEFPFSKYIAGTFITALLLGSLGFAGAGLSGNVIVGYLMSVCYYVLNTGLGKKLGSFYLFTMSRSFVEKYYLLAMAVVFIAATFIIIFIKYKKR